ncbi:MAG TPA: (d)CMP kinase, partial [Aestuariivirgaceae bacterium]|nr:(d)CMP kinase [Aestuariivirgaceae bacterium]
MIIAVDGPAASGKGTLGRQLAEHYGLAYLDTGSLYRAVALGVLKAGKSPEDESAALEAAGRLDRAAIADDEIRRAGLGEAASIVAAFPAVRQRMLGLQRAIAGTPPGAVLDGRDIGTIVCPDADVKLFVTASAEVRARRRMEELVRNGENASFEDVLQWLRERDHRDETRPVAPLKRAGDAHLLDTSDLDIEATFQAAVSI